MIKYSRIINTLFLFFIIFLLVISFNEYFGRFLNKYYPDFYAYECSFKLFGEEYKECQSRKTLYKYIWVENGLVENLQLILDLRQIGVIILIERFILILMNLLVSELLQLQELDQLLSSLCQV